MKTKSVFVAIVGRPNVGKSTLLNVLVGEKVAIVSPKPQTTRTRITGVLTQNETQLVFIDTPGIHMPKTKLSGYMVRQIRESVADVDIAVLVCEPTGPITAAELDLLESFKSRKLPAILAVNKIDTLPRKQDMMEKIKTFSGLFEFDEIIPICATQGDGVPILLEKLKGYAAEGPHYFDEDSYTDQPERTIIAEIIREKLLIHLQDELPHGIAVAIESMKDREGSPITDIHASIICEKKSHKGMIIGKEGAMLKKIGMKAREDIEAFLECKINLQLWVKVKDDWRNREGSIKQLGFE